MKHLNFRSRFLILLLGFLTIGISQAWGVDYTYAGKGTFTKQTSVDGDGYYVFVMTPGALTNSASSNYIGVNTSYTGTANSLTNVPVAAVLRVAGYTSGKYYILNNSDYYMYSSADKKITYSSTTSQYWKVASKRLQTDETTTKYMGYVSGSGFRPYTKSATNSTDFVCVYKLVSEKTNVKYDANGKSLKSGSTLPADAKVDAGKDYNVSTATVAADGYKFIGWNTDMNATNGITKVPATTMVKDATVILYAIWKSVYSITPSVTGSGTIQFSTNGTNWSNTIADQEANADVYFKLVPNAGYEVSGTPTVSNVAAGNITENNGVYKFAMPASAVTVSATFSCATPTFKTDLVEQTIEKVQNVGSLTLNVEKNESWATYQWQSSANKTDWVDIAGKTSASYSPSIATIGTTYYRCLLKNGVGSCGTSAPSNVVTLVVNAPSKCETPTFSLATGTYNDPQSVELHCVTEGATIYYTTDGTEPSTSSTEYTGAINVFKTMTIRAIAAKDGIESSEEGTITYTIQYTVTFNMQSHGSQVADQKVGYEGLVTDPQTKSITGWTFGGWFKEGACNNQWNFATDKVTDHTTLYAKWDKTMFDVNFYNNGGLVQTYNIQEGQTIGTLPTLTTTDAKDARSKTFVGWTTDKLTNWQEQAPTPVTSTKVVEGELTLNAVWAKEVGVPSTDYSKITSTNALTDGNYVIAYQYGSGDQIALKAEEDDEYYELHASKLTLSSGKYTNPNTDYIWEIKKQSNNTFSIYNAKTSKYVYGLVDTEGSGCGLQNEAYGFNFTYDNTNSRWLIELSNATGYYFHGFVPNYGDSYFTVSQTPGQSGKGNYKVYLYKNESTLDYTDYITHSSSSPLASITLNTDNVKKNYFEGEEFTSAGLTATATLGDGITFPIEFNDLKITEPSLASAGEKAVTVKYTFNGATQSATYDVNAYSVTINPVYTDRVDDEPVTGNTYSWTPTTGALKFSTQAHYQFNGITSEVVGVTLNGPKPNYTLSNPTANVTLTAEWQRLFTLQYDSKGGAAVSSVTDVTSGTQVETMPSPKFTGYDLVGWYNNEDYTGDAVTFPYAITKDETLFAKWEVKTTEITLSQTDATTKGTEKVIATWGQPMPTTDVTMPQREHYQFAGYTHSNVLYYNADGTSAKNWDKEFATATLTAQWTINKHKIILPAVLAGGSLSFSTGTSDVSYNATVTITATPNTHYTLTALTWNGHDILSSKSFQMPDEDVTIEATFTEDPKRTISWSVGGSIAATTNDVYDGTAFATIKANAPAVTDNAAGDCADKFMGWAIAPINTQGGIDKENVQWADDATTSETQNTFYAVFAKGETTSTTKETTYSYEFTSKQWDSNGDKTLNGVTWTMENNGGYYGYDGTKGHQFGSGSYPAKALTISTSNLVGKVKSVKVSTSGASSVSATVAISVGGTSYLSATSITTSDSPYSGTGTSSGEIKITWSQTSSKALYVKLIEVIYDKTESKTVYSNYITQCCTTPEHPLEITNTNLTVKTNGTLKLNTTEGIKDVTKVWASKNGAVATVDQEGLVTPVSTGKAIITVSQAATNGFCAQYDEVEIEVIAANEFGISFTAAEGGSAVSKVNGTQTSKATTDTQVTIEATTASDDYNFTGWTVNAGGVTLADASKATTTFVMGEADVEITPSFAIKQFTITLDAGTGDVETTSYTKDVHTFINLPAAAHCQPDVWAFQGWSETNLTAAASECPALVDNNYEITKDVTLYAIYKKADGGEQTIGYKISYQANSNTYYASAGVSAKKMSVSPNANDAVVFGMTTTSGQSKLYRVDANGTLISGSYIYLDSNKDLVQGADGDNDKHKWTISMTGTHSIINVGENGRCIAGRSGKDDLYVINASVANVDKPEGVNGNYFHHITLIPVVKGAASYCTSPECVSLTWVNEMSGAAPSVTYPGTDGKLVLPAETPASCAPGLYSFVGWTKTEIPTYKTSQQEIVTAEMAAPEHATTYYAEFVNTAGNRYRTTCPETLYAITYKANGGEGEDYIQYSENKTDVTSYDGAAFSKTDCSLYQWNTTANGTGTAYKPNANISSLTGIVGEGTTGTLYAQWTGELNVSGNVHLTSGKDIAVYTTAPAGNLITISCPAIDMVHHIRYKFLDSENNQVSTLKLCNNGTENFNQLTNITTDGVVGAYEQTFSICYTPTEYNQSATYTLLLEGVNQGGNTVYNSCSLTIAVRSLPEQFVIAIKKDNKWYAVPNVLATTASAAPDALLIDVNDANNPTYAISNDNATNALYKSAGRYEATKHRGAIRLQSVVNDNYITATTTDNTSFYMKSGNDQDQQFYLNSTDCNVYKVTLDPAEYENNVPTRWVCMNGVKIGWYKNDNETKNVYFLPLKTITEEIEVNDGETKSLSDYEVDENTTVIVHAGGIFNADKVATIGNLTIERMGDKSGQVIETATLTANNAYFDLTLNAQGMKWYDIAVPFTVDRLQGLSLPDGNKIPLNDVLVYDGEARATNGANGSAWQYQDNGDLNPGVGYDIMFASNVTTVRFTKKADAQLNNEEDGSIIVEEFESQTGSEMDANWNYVANNTLHYVNLGFDDSQNSGVIAQTYNPEDDNYTAYTQAEATYLVGTPFFVQVVVEDFVVWGTTPIHNILRAPAMTTNRVERFTLELSTNGEMNDRLFVSADENARNEYQIGKDVAKMGVSSTIAQMWIDNYNTKLCANEAILYNGTATYQMGIFIPKESEYTIAITNAPENATLYLTMDGLPIWNLSESAYTTNFTKGTHTEFGLLLQANTQSTPTNINSLNGNNKAQKIFKDYNIYILRDAQMYNTQGVKVQ